MTMCIYTARADRSTLLWHAPANKCKETHQVVLSKKCPISIIPFHRVYTIVKVVNKVTEFFDISTDIPQERWHRFIYYIIKNTTLILDLHDTNNFRSNINIVIYYILVTECGMRKRSGDEFFCQKATTSDLSIINNYCMNSIGKSYLIILG